MTSAAIIGAGHNGLVAAFYLARAGLDVRVYEGLDAVGGACKTEELIPGYRFSTCANFLMWMRPKVAEDLGLIHRGLEAVGGRPKTRIMEGNRPFVYWQDSDDLLREIAQHSKRDAAAWPEWAAFWKRAADLLGPHLLSYAPTLAQLRAGANEDDTQLLDTLIGSPLAALADRYFRSPELRGSIEAPHDVGSLYEPGSSLMQAVASAMELYSETGSTPPYGFVRGGMGAVTALMAEAAQEVGAEIITGLPVSQILVEQDRVRGIELLGGEQVAADVVLSNADVKRTFATLLVGVEAIAHLARKVESAHTEVAPLKLHCALSALPTFPAFGDSDIWTSGPLVIQPNREYHERSWIEARGGEPPSAPYMSLMTPSRHDRSLAPPGHETISVWILFAPVRLMNGDWAGRREEIADRLIDYISAYSPDFRACLVDRFLLTPWDLERRVNLTDGNIHHVDMIPSQILGSRPLPELANYRTPVDGLYLCGAGQHPNGEVTGAPGHNAAHAVLDDLHGLGGSWQETRRSARHRQAAGGG